MVVRYSWLNDVWCARLKIVSAAANPTRAISMTTIISISVKPFFKLSIFVSIFLVSLSLGIHHDRLKGHFVPVSGISPLYGQLLPVHAHVDRFGKKRTRKRPGERTRSVIRHM